MLKQGDAPKSALLEEISLTPNAVLFGTSSFCRVSTYKANNSAA